MLNTHTFQSREPSVAVRHVFVLALLVAALIFALHHLPPLSGHALLASTGVFIGAALVAALVGALLARRSSDPPIVMIGARGASEVQQAHEEDLDFCAQLHTQALPHGFFASLGPGFMRAYYRTFLTSPHATALVASTRGHRMGFVVGVLHAKGHAQWVMRHHGAGLALRGVAALAVRPRLAVRFVRSRVGRYAATWRRHRKPESQQAATPRPDSTPAVLSHMAVVPGARGTGIGSELVRSFEATASEAGARGAILTTLAGTEGSGSFYAGLGWDRRRSRANLDGAPTEEWSRALGEGA